MKSYLHYIEKGTGEALIFLHGNGEDGSCFGKQIAFFSKYYKVYAIDTRGHGYSPRGTKPFTLKQFSIDLLDFMDEHGIEKAGIIGFSDGANIALMFAMKHPDRITKLVLCGANLNPAGLKPGVKRQINFMYHFYLKGAAFSQTMKKKAEYYRLMVREPSIKKSDLYGITVKTLVVAGTDDVIKDDHTRLIAISLPNAELKTIEGDHFLPYKRSDEFNHVVYKFLIG